ncbi:hypothetical protein, partial [Aliikangiella maris]
ERNIKFTAQNLNFKALVKANIAFKKFPPGVSAVYLRHYVKLADDKKASNKRSPIAGIFVLNSGLSNCQNLKLTVIIINFNEEYLMKTQQDKTSITLKSHNGEIS